MALAWDAFLALDGAPDRNFELLWRAIVQRNYGRFGQLKSTRNQPGVEFHMRLDANCDLGEAGRWFGWQCKWYDLGDDHQLGATRRARIEDAIAKAKSAVVGLTDFVLCLKELPAKDDVDWYHDLDVGLRLHLWADEELETRLTGDAEILRRTYFGELVLSAHQLAEAHARAIEPLRNRWVPGLHVTTEIEENVRVALAQPDGATPFAEQAARLSAIAQSVQDDWPSPADTSLEEPLKTVTDAVRAMASHLAAVADSCQGGRPREARELIDVDPTPAIPVANVRAFARRLRAKNVRVALAATQVEGELRAAVALLAEYRGLMLSRMLAIVGDAGRGKTQLSAELTAPSADRMAGIFIRGSELRAGGTLNELAGRVPGINAETFDDLLEALDAAGTRVGARVAIVIDGLNDAERPAEWRTLLAELKPALEKHDHVLVVVTLRGTVRDDVLPDDTLQCELDWLDIEVQEAVTKYFDYYRIDPGATRLPLRLFAIPLFLRLFCEAVNPDHESEAGVEAIPSTLVATFELYWQQTAKRLRTRQGHATLPEGHVERRVAALALELWRKGLRELPFDDARAVLDDGSTNWDESLLHALEDEGVLFRESPYGSAEPQTAILFDRFAGYLIADAVTRGLTVDQLDQTLSADDFWARLRGSADQRHALAEDILIGLIGVLPRRFSGEHLWQFAPMEARHWTLLQTLDLESRYLDRNTVDALHDLIRSSGPPQWRRRHPFDRLWEVRDGTDHQLNARFLHRVLSDMPVADRDLHWTEWVRARIDSLQSDVEATGELWTRDDARDDADDLKALAVAWILTSTSLPLRDLATKALQRYGRPEPARLFSLAGELLDVNDPYVVERVVASSFGAATYHQMPDPGGPFERALGTWISELQRRYLGPDAAAPTSHQMQRQYIAGAFELAARLHPASFPNGGGDPENLDFALGGVPDPIGDDDARKNEVDHTIRMDFENYTIGGLYEGRGNYQMDHPAHVRGLAEVRGRIWELGWRSASFQELDRQIADDQWRRNDNPNRTERYGKKYGWIAYYELAGRLDDRGELRDRTWTSGRGVWPDIDPTFPETPRPLDVEMPLWASQGPDGDALWYRGGAVEVPGQFLAPEELNGELGPWLLVEAWLEHRDRERGRRVWGFVRGLLVAPELAHALVQMLEARPYLGNDFVPHTPEDYGTFAGEIPWSARFSQAGDLENGLAPYFGTVTERWGEPGIDVELLGHAYEIEASRTVTNAASGHWVPSHSLASALHLRQRPGTLDLVTLDGRIASRTLSGPPNFSGRLLYIQRELLSNYAAGRRLVQLVWGERQVELDWDRSLPKWFEEARHEDAEKWRHVALTDL